MTPASIRTNNPGAQWYGPLAQAYGATGQENLSDGNNAAVFPDPVSGAAAQFALLRKKYAGLPLSAAISKWSGGNSSPEYTKFLTDKTGLSPDTVLTPDLINGPQGLSLAKAQAHWEAGQPYPMSDADWQKAQTAAANETPMSQAMNKAQPMADQGALSPNSYLGPGALDAVSGGLQGLGAGLLAINNPAGGAAMMSAYQNALTKNRPQLVDMGTDPLTGKKKYGLYDPSTQSFKPFGGGAAGGGKSASAGDDMDTEQFQENIGKVQRGEMSVDDFQKSLNPLVAQYAKSMVEGNADPRMLGNRAGAVRPFAIAAAHVLDPNFNENDIDARKAEVKNLATSNNPSTLGGAIASLGKLSLHGDQLAEASKKLADLQAARGTLRPLNWLENTYKQNLSQDQEYKTALNSLKAAVDLYAPEADRATTGKPSTVTGSENIRALFSPDISHDERMAAARRVQGMAQDAANQLVYNNNRAFGRLGTGQEKTVEDFMSPEVRKSWANLQKVTSPSGGEPQPAAQAQPAAPVTKTLNGKQYHNINGKWYTE